MENKEFHCGRPFECIYIAALTSILSFHVPNSSPAASMSLWHVLIRENTLEYLEQKHILLHHECHAEDSFLLMPINSKKGTEYPSWVLETIFVEGKVSTELGSEWKGHGSRWVHHHALALLITQGRAVLSESVFFVTTVIITTVQMSPWFECER